jgi:proteasome beta subunit
MNEDIQKNMLKTGTSILGIVCKDGIVMAADRQVTGGGSIILQKNMQKVNKINDYIVFSFCGGAADALMLGKLLTAELKLKELKTKQRPTVKEAANLVGSISFKGVREPSMMPPIVGSLVAGFNKDGTTELYTIEPAGGVYLVEDYDANFGSGMPYILGLLERQYKKDLTVKEGIQLAQEAIKSSTQRDTASGFGIDVFSITKEGIQQVVSQEIVPEFKNRN